MNRGWQLVDCATDRVVLPQLEIADTFWRRFVGLQCRRGLPPDAGFLLVPCNGIHTCFMRFPIDVIYLAEDGIVLRTVHHLKPWRATRPLRGVRYVLETLPDATSLAPGDRVCVTRGAVKIQSVPAAIAPLIRERPA